MTAPDRLLWGAWGFSALAVLAALGAWTHATPDVAVGRPPSIARAPTVSRPDTAGLGQAAARIRDRDAFRVARRPADVRFSPWGVASRPELPPRIRPALALTGIIGGPPWSALVEGIPGRESGVLLIVGEESNGIRLTAVRGDTALLAGFDTTWALTPRRPWR